MLFLRYYLWFAPHLLLGFVLIGSIRRKLPVKLPIFFSYLVFELAQFLALFAISRMSPFPIIAYRWGLALGMGLSGFLIMGVIYELANDLLLSRSALRPSWCSILRRTAALLLLVAAIVSAVLSRFDLGRTMNVFQVVDFSGSVVQSGLLVALFLFSRAFHISWRSPAAGVALGFGIAGSLELASAALRGYLRGYLGPSGFVAVDIVQMAAFHVSVVVWLVYVFLPERVPTFSGGGLQKSEIEFWNQELQRMVRR
jgi:hypothetical protein